MILVRWETTPDDINGIIFAQGHPHRPRRNDLACGRRRARDGKPCVAAARAVVDATAGPPRSASPAARGRRDHHRRRHRPRDRRRGPPRPAQINEDFQTILEWADGLRRLRVRANADNPDDAARAREFGAQGIGLCRTEHMFFGDERLPLVQEMILASSEAERRSALDRLLPHQQADFEGIFEAMVGLPVTIRLLDPPLHEFLPSLEEATDERMRARIRALHEANPMLGTRGCRLGLMYPEIYEMQVRAIVARGDRGARADRRSPARRDHASARRLPRGARRLRELTVAVATEEGELEYQVGTMIELPRACVRADEIAEVADFCSFGTNDLTQTALGLSRDDAEGKFLTRYLEDGVLERNPFEVLDEEGVGELMRIAVERGRSVKDDLKMGICGEHGGEPRSVAFCHRIGLDYVSCSPFRVPLARLAAAQAALKESGVEAAVAGG